MSETKFTPGPWEIDKHNHDWIVTSSEKYVGHLAEVRSNLAYPYHSEEMQQAKKANGTLISAAPDLYNALEALLGWVAEWAVAEGQGIQVQDDITAAARAALAKARGE
jgi:hypothetical protein